MRRRISIVATTLAIGVLVAGCAKSVAGTAEVDAAAAASLAAASSTTSTSGSDTTTSSPDTGITTPGTDSTAPTTDSTGTSSPPTTGDSSSTSSATGGDTGDYPTTPLSIPATPANQTDALLLEARRIGDVLPTPTLVDKSYSVNVLPTLPLKGPTALSSLVFTDPTPTVAQRQGMVTGFVSARRTADSSSSIVIGAFEFPSDAKSTAAVKPLANSVKDTGYGDKAVSIPGHTGAQGWTGHSTTSGYRTQVFEVVGPMVLYAYVESKASSNQPALIKSLLDAMDAAYKSFTVTPTADLMKLPNDTDGMAAHTVPNTGDNLTVIDGVYTADGALNFDSDPVATQALFKANGVDLVSYGAANVYRAKDAGAATAVRDGFIDETRAGDSKWQPVSISAAPDSASCLQQALNATYYCVATSGRYMLEINSKSETDAAQLLNAQTAMLSGF